MRVEDVAGELGCSPATIHRWVDKFGLDRRGEKGGPWTDREKLIELYWGRGMSQREIAEELGCNQATISKWFSEHDIPARHTYQEYGNFFTDPRGYEWFTTTGDRVRINRLLAVAEYGFEAVRGMDVHHKNRIPWDNRHENVEPLTPEEHRELHRDELIESRWGR